MRTISIRRPYERGREIASAVQPSQRAHQGDLRDVLRSYFDSFSAVAELASKKCRRNSSTTARRNSEDHSARCSEHSTNKRALIARNSCATAPNKPLCHHLPAMRQLQCPRRCLPRSRSLGSGLPRVYGTGPTSRLGPSVMPSEVIVYSRMSGWWLLARVFKTVTARVS